MCFIGMSQDVLLDLAINVVSYEAKEYVQNDQIS